MPELAIGLWLLYFALVFGVRVLVQLRMTGRTGLVSLRKFASPLEWVAGGLFVFALASGFASSVLSLARPADALWRPQPLPAAAGALGALVYLAGLATTFAAQVSMGRSWRIGVDASEHTELVARGLFRFVRNPIYTGLLLTAAGLALLCCSWAAWSACLLLLVALELQVRGVEEPHLARVHGETYRRYAERVGRFVPGIGRGFG